MTLPSSRFFLFFTGAGRGGGTRIAARDSGTRPCFTNGFVRNNPHDSQVLVISDAGAVFPSVSFGWSFSNNAGIICDLSTASLFNGKMPALLKAPCMDAGVSCCIGWWRTTGSLAFPMIGWGLANPSFIASVENLSFNGPMMFTSNDCKMWVVCDGSPSRTMFSSLAFSTTGKLICDEWLSISSITGLCLPQFGTKILQNHEKNNSLSIYPSVDVAKFHVPGTPSLNGRCRRDSFKIIRVGKNWPSPDTHRCAVTWLLVVTGCWYVCCSFIPNTFLLGPSFPDHPVSSQLNTC